MMPRQLWRELIDHPTRAFDPEAAGLTLIAGGGEAAHHYALRRWLGLRAGQSTDALAAIAVILAEAFGDRQALDVLANSNASAYPDELTRFDGALGPKSMVAQVFGERILVGLRAYLEDESDLPFDLLAAASRFRLDDRGQVYLALRTAAVARTSGTPSAVLGESFADRALEVAALVTPNRPEVQQTVLAHWGINFPTASVPVEESRPGFAPTRWLATSHLIAGIDQPSIADLFIELACSDGYWRTPTTDAETFVAALRDTAGTTAVATLEEIAQAGVSVSSAALDALLERHRRITLATDAALARINEVTDRLLATSVIQDPLSTDVVAALVPQFACLRNLSDTRIATTVLTAIGAAGILRVMGQVEPPFVDAVQLAMRFHGSSVGFDNAFLEPTANPDEWILRFTRNGVPYTRDLTSICNMLHLDGLKQFLSEATAYAAPSRDRRFLVLDHNYLDAVVGYVPEAAWSRFLAGCSP